MLTYLILAVVFLVSTIVVRLYARREFRVLETTTHKLNGKLDLVVESFGSSAESIHEIRNSVLAYLNRRTFTVLVFGQCEVIDWQSPQKEKLVQPFLWGQTGRIESGQKLDLALPVQVPLAPGAMVLCIGDADLVGLCVGKDQQTPWPLAGSPVCVTQKKVEVGVHVVIQLKGRG